MSFLSLEDVLARPYPSLDQNTQQFQFNAYQHAVHLLLTSTTPIMHAIPAGAGSGKTRLCVAILNALLGSGYQAEEIEAITFTNAAANDFRRKHIESLVHAPDDLGIEAENISFSTIHSCAMGLLKKLQPHMDGVSYYFEDASTGSQNDDDSARKQATELALYATVVYGDQGNELLDTLADFPEDDNRLILDDLAYGDHLAKANKLIKQEMATDVGLGAFTNMNDGSPDFCIAVATDSLMRLYKSNIDIATKRRDFGIPAFLMVDEAQDLDFLQLLLLRAMALNGTSIIMVGDSRQTLYEFRQSLSDLPFQPKFMADFVKGTPIVSTISPHALKTNYRCRKEIIEAAEDVSRLAVTYMHERLQRDNDVTHLAEIGDPPFVATGVPFIVDANRDEKCLPAITVLEGQPVDVIMEKPSARPKPTLGALGRLPEYAEPTNVGPKNRKKKTRSQILSLSGGSNEALIKKHIVSLFERAKAKETVCIITRNNQRETDLAYLRQVIGEVYPEDIGSLEFNILNPQKNFPLSEFWFINKDNRAVNELPFTSVMIAAAITYIMSYDKRTQETVQKKGMKPLKSVFITPEGIREKLDKNKHIETIAEEIRIFFDAFLSKADKLLPDADEHGLKDSLDSLRMIAARFTFDVIAQYGQLLWKKVNVPTNHPCRFQDMACQYVKEGNLGFVIRPLHETKSYLKTMWRAISSTRFGIGHEDRRAIEMAGFSPEAMTPATDLINFNSMINDHCLISGRKHGLSDRREDFIRDREAIYDEFSRLWHIKTRKYMRSIAKELGKAVRNDSEAPEIAYRKLVCDTSFFDAKKEAGLNITTKPDKAEYGGLFSDFASAMSKDVVFVKKDSKEDTSKGKIRINMTTIHSSKGLEWDHVLFYFPTPSPHDYTSSFKSARDLIYVAMTRAARTLAIIIKKHQKLKETPKDTCIKVFTEVMHQWAKAKGLHNRLIDYGSPMPEVNNKSVTVFDETSHSELERSQACQMHHYYQDMRNVSTMVPLTTPSYAFFFHSVMSSICAALINQRIAAVDDKATVIAQIIELAVSRKMGETDTFALLREKGHDEIYVFMECMIPLYNLGDSNRHKALMTYYVDSFTHHLAAITHGSQLFKLLLKYRDNPQYKISIEKSVRRVLVAESGQRFMPIMGIPDIKIEGPELTYVADYKTVPNLDGKKDEKDKAKEKASLIVYEASLSKKTEQQINYYQGMVPAQQHGNYLAELLYVSSLGVMDHEDVPKACIPLPHIGQGRNYKIVAGVEHARILYTNIFDKDQFTETMGQISMLRETYKTNKERPHNMFRAEPLIEDCGEVTDDQCGQCASGVHCSLNKSMKIEAVNV